ncbi:MARCKS-related protein isoform X3 [Amblyraja radiata]|uniref:MARCKS-related protein isoform X3 n=1 Tax=Amblyraja radiata TaxID=386614 RepID=UPI001401E65F|nr:MARCKS-related protein isoform X3 [Amblyraja radiata]
MGSTLAKSKPKEQGKTSGQENGHVKINGDTSPTKADGETVVATVVAGDVCAAEAGKESPGDGIVPAPAAEGEAKADTPKKKKKKALSFKKFKLGKLSFKRGRRGETAAAAAAGPAEAAAGEAVAAAAADEPRAEGQPDTDTGATDTKPGGPEVEEPSAAEGTASPESGSTDAARDQE